MPKLQTCIESGRDCQECLNNDICHLFDNLPEIHIEFQWENNKEKGVNE